MALINCPECNKEISDKAMACIHCGLPLREPAIAVSNDTGSSVIESVTSLPIEAPRKKNMLKIIIPVIIVVMLVVGTVAVYYWMNVAPQNKKNDDYNSAISLLERGKYEESMGLLDNLRDFKDVNIIQEQIKYESIAYVCINDLKSNLKAPDSYTPYEILFFLLDQAIIDKNTIIAKFVYLGLLNKTEKPLCVMHYGAQNGIGGITTRYALFLYSEEDSAYSLLGTCGSLDEQDFSDDGDVLEYVTMMTINALLESGVEVGSIDMSRLKTVLKNDAYSTIKIIE